MKLIEVSPGLLDGGGDSPDGLGMDRKMRVRCRLGRRTGQGFILNALLVPFNNDVIRAVEAGVVGARRHRSRDQGGAPAYKMGPLELLSI